MYYTCIIQASTDETNFAAEATDRYHEIFEEYSKFGRHPYAEFINSDHVYAQSDSIENILKMKISFKGMNHT